MCETWMDWDASILSPTPYPHSVGKRESHRSEQGLSPGREALTEPPGPPRPRSTISGKCKLWACSHEYKMGVKIPLTSHVKWSSCCGKYSGGPSELHMEGP